MSTSPPSRAVPLAWFLCLQNTSAAWNRGFQEPLAELCTHLSSVTPPQALGPREHLTEALLIPAVQLGPGRVCSTTSGSSAGRPQTSARLCTPYRGQQGQRPPPRLVPPLSSRGGSRTADRTPRPQRVSSTHHPPWIQPRILPRVFLGGRGTPTLIPPTLRRHQPPPLPDLAHPSQLYGGEGGA